MHRALILLLGLASPPALAGSAGGGALALGWQTSARHIVAPAVFGWASLTDTRFVPTVELMGTWRTHRAGPFRYGAAHLRLSVVGEVTVGQHPTRLHLGLGPAVSGRLATLRTEGDQWPVHSVAPGARARLALQGPLGDHLAFCWQLGATSRWLTLDYDAAIGLGARW